MYVATKITGAVLSISLVVTAITLILAIDIFQSELEDTITQKLSIEAMHVIDKIDRVIFERRSDVKILTLPDKSILSNSQYSLDQKLSLLRSFEMEKKVYVSISLYDTRGIKLGDTQSIDIGDNASEKNFFREAMNGNVYSDPRPIMSESLDIPVLHFSSPIKNVNGTITGVLVTRYPLAKIHEAINQVSLGLSGTGNVNIDLLDREGTRHFLIMIRKAY